MNMLAIIKGLPPVAPPRSRPRPLAYVAPVRPLLGGRQARTVGALAAVLEEFGYSSHVGMGSSALALPGTDEAALERAEIVVCDVVRPRADLPVEVALAAVRGTPVIALVPEDATIEGMAADVLGDCRGRVVRYEKAPHQALHRLLGERNRR